MAVFTRLVFPLRVVSFFSLYLVLNVTLYSRTSVIRKYILNKYSTAPISSPSLPENIVAVLDANITSFGEYQTYRDSIWGWVITADIFLVFLFICMILGFLANKPATNFVISVLHFIGVVLTTHMIVNYADIDFLICAAVFGAFLPGFVEIFNIISLFAFKNDYYYQSK